MKIRKKSMLEGAKSIGAGAATIASAGAAIGIGNVFSSLIHSVARNSSLAKQSFAYAKKAFAYAKKTLDSASNTGYFLASRIYTNKKYVEVAKSFQKLYLALLLIFCSLSLLRGISLCVLLATDGYVWEQLPSAIRPSLCLYMAPVESSTAPDLDLSLAPPGSSAAPDMDSDDPFVKFLDQFKRDDLDLLRQDLAETGSEMDIIKKKLDPFVPKLPDLNFDPPRLPPQLPDLNEAIDHQRIARIQSMLDELERYAEENGEALNKLSIYFQQRKQLYEFYKWFTNHKVYCEDVKKRRKRS